jgi:hypothetical protein
MSDDSKTTDAPHPWSIEDHTDERHGGRGYLSIVDAAGNRICDFFPWAAKGGRGLEATLRLARLVLQWEREHA